MDNYYFSHDKVNWKDQIVCPKCNKTVKKEFIKDHANGHWRCTNCKTKVLEHSVVDKEKNI